MPIIFLAVILKIPVLYGMWLIYWAVKAEPELEDQPGDADDHSFRRWRRNPIKPRGPRRGPHGGDGPGATGLPAWRPHSALRVIEPRLAPGTAAHERREPTPAGS